MTPPDKEEFQAWKAQPLTQWVLSRLRQQTQEQAQDLQERLLNSAAQPPADWAQQQPQAAYLKGHFDQAILLINSEVEYFMTSDEIEALEKRESEANGQ
jgi:hypothetical protein